MRVSFFIYFSTITTISIHSRSSLVVDSQKFSSPRVANPLFETLSAQEIVDSLPKSTTTLIYDRETRTSSEYDNDVVTINEMSCRNDDDEVYFRASISSSKSFTDATIDNPYNHTTRKNCKTSISRDNKNNYRIELSDNEFWNCGVINCSDFLARYYCLNVKFSKINGLRLWDDYGITLRCRASSGVEDEIVAAHARRFGFRIIDTSEIMSRKIVTGGADRDSKRRELATELGLYRNILGSGDGFVEKIEPGSEVVLGEDIMLRAKVRDGDGWRYSKISDVAIKSYSTIETNNDNNRQQLRILDDDGCLTTPELREISPNEQYHDNGDPLVSLLTFKVFAFDDDDESNAMSFVLTLRITGCVNGNDCVVDCSRHHARRARRDVDDKSTVGYRDDVIGFRIAKRRGSSIASSSSSSLVINDTTTKLWSLLLFLMPMAIVVM